MRLLRGEGGGGGNFLTGARRGEFPPKVSQVRAKQVPKNPLSNQNRLLLLWERQLLSEKVCFYSKLYFLLDKYKQPPTNTPFSLWELMSLLWAFWPLLGSLSPHTALALKGKYTFFTGYTLLTFTCD